MIKYLKVEINDEDYSKFLEKSKERNIKVEEFDSSQEMFMYEEVCFRLESLEDMYEKKIDDPEIREQLIDELCCSLLNNDYVIDVECVINIIKSRIIEFVPDFFEEEE